jgi:hypothetical protein
VPGVGIGVGRRRVEAVDVGEQHQHVGTDHGGDPRGEAVVVAVADLARRYGVVLVDHGHGPDLEELEHRRAGIEVATPLLRVLGGHEDLARCDAVVAEGL